MKSRPLLLTAVAFGYGAFGCGSEPAADPATGSSQEVMEPLVVDVSVKHQRMLGFGASSAWTAPFMSEDLAEQFFSPDTGLGLSLLRIQIRPDGTSSELGTADLAAAYGADIWASPWSPPSELKTNGSTRGGALEPAAYGTWAQTLANFAASMRDRGTPLLGISAQNEPDYDAPWDSCVFTAGELADFVANYLVPELSATAPEVKVIAPESANWNTLRSYGDALLAEPSALPHLLAVATHEYGGSAFRYERVHELEQQLWVTETSDANKTTDVGMNSALRTAFQINTALTRANVSAWHYWWLFPRVDNEIPDDNSALTDPDLQLTKRAFALGQFSRFIRPQFDRVDTTGTLARQVVASGYLSPDGQHVVVVLVSDRFEPLEQIVRVPGLELTSAEMWVTDASRSLEATTPPELSAHGNGVELKVSLPANSVVTLVARTDAAEPAPEPSTPPPGEPSSDVNDGGA